MDAIVGAVTAVLLAAFGLLAWRLQLISQRRFAVAEDAIVSFMLARHTLDYARNGASYEGEGSTRSQIEGESESERSIRDAYFTPVERINKDHDRFVKLEGIMLLARHHLGEDAYRAFETLIRAKNRVSFSASFLIKNVGRNVEWTDEAAKRHQKWEADIWATNDDDDTLSRELDVAERALRAKCDREAKVTAALWPFR
ncbi:MAG: hypothetical protein AB7J28_08990 [Hyphomonadaceae bacterium]